MSRNPRPYDYVSRRITAREWILKEITDLEEKMRGQPKALSSHRNVETSVAQRLHTALFSVVHQQKLDSFLPQIAEALRLYAEFKVIQRSQGSAFNKARIHLALGPKTRREKAEKKRRIVFAHAKELWARKNNFKGDQINTAYEIYEKVNAELLARGLQRIDESMAPKTIADHIRQGMNNGIL